MALSLSDLELVLQHLLNRRGDDLRRLSAGANYERALLRYQQRLVDIAGEVDGPTQGRPLATELEEVDRYHDGFGAAVWHQLQSYLRLPTASDALKATASELLDVFIPALIELRSSFADEAARARQRRQLLAFYERSLREFAVFGGGTLYEWVDAQISHGEALERLLQQRLRLEQSRPGPLDDQALHAELLLVLDRLRRTVQGEVVVRADLPRDLEDRLFSFFDLLEATRSQQ